MEGNKTAELNYEDGKRHGEFRSWDVPLTPTLKSDTETVRCCKQTNT